MTSQIVRFINNGEIFVGVNQSGTSSASKLAVASLAELLTLPFDEIRNLFAQASQKSEVFSLDRLLPPVDGLRGLPTTVREALEKKRAIMLTFTQEFTTQNAPNSFSRVWLGALPEMANQLEFDLIPK